MNIRIYVCFFKWALIRSNANYISNQLVLYLYESIIISIDSLSSLSIYFLERS